MTACHVFLRAAGTLRRRLRPLVAVAPSAAARAQVGMFALKAGGMPVTLDYPTAQIARQPRSGRSS